MTQKRPPEPLNHAEVDALLRICSVRSWSGIRNRALIVLLWRSGVRCAEALAIRPCDIDREKQTISVLHGKGDKARLVAIDRWALTEIDLWISHRSSWKIPASAPLFCTRTGKAIETSHVRRMLPRLAKKAGITRRVHAHGLRHTFAVKMREEGIDIGFISHQLGHSDIETTVRYIRHVAPTDALRAVHKMRWNNPVLRKPSGNTGHGGRLG